MADINKSRGLDEEQAKGITVKVDVDVSEALTGLKAVTREAKTAQKALRELEAIKPVNLEGVSTEDLARELAFRKCVREYGIIGKERLALRFEDEDTTVDVVGPAKILVYKLTAPEY